MARPMVFIDLETTGLDETADEIIEFGAVRVRDGRIAEEFSRLAHPGRQLPLAITKLTGITDADLRRQRPSHVVLGEFIDFVGDDTVVAHNARFERAFLCRKSDDYFTNPFIDTLELARILFPTFEHHDLDTLADRLGLAVASRHRAIGDARLLVELWDRFGERLDALPLEVVAGLSIVASRTGWPARHLFVDAEARRLTGAFDVGQPRYHKLFAEHGELLNAARSARRKKDPSERPAPSRLNVHQLTDLFAPGGPFARNIPAYEQRPQQVRMVELVAQAFNDGRHLLVEAGTGVGKSMAYLVPAMHWAALNRDPIILSTKTKNLQEQLFFKDIPLLTEQLRLPIKTALIKGRRNYLCVRKFLYLLEEGEADLTEDECIALLPIIVWAAETRVGDAAEAAGFLAFRQRELWDKLCSASEECAGPACKRRRNCFLNRARALSLLADLVVANHAVVFSELGLDSAVIPDYAHLVFDEAHNLEAAATDHLGCELDRWTAGRLIRRLLRRDRGGREHGLLPSIRFRMKRGREEDLTDAERDLDHFILNTFADVLTVEQDLAAFLDSLDGLFPPNRRGSETLRYAAEGRDPSRWQPVEAHKTQLVAAIGLVRRRLATIVERLEDLGERDFPYRAESIFDVRGIHEALGEVATNADFLVAGDDDAFVYWVERIARRRGRFSYRIAAAPIRIGPKMKEVLYDAKDTIIFTSATLSAAGKFDFLKDRIGLDQLEPERLLAEDVGSPFDYDRQMIVCVPAFLPEPGREDGSFTEDVARLLIDAFRATAGRALGLFTSYAMLNAVYGRAKTALEAEQILVLGQGFDGARRSITRTFQRETHSVLLGTDSFWEGVDVPGQSLSCVVIVKLPFAVYTAPIVQARCEEVESRGLSAFRHYTLPSAVIRFKQGAGRLIRTKTDHGALIVLDRRVLTRNYGSQFLRTLPTTYRTCSSPRHLCDMIRAFLAVHAPTAP